MGERWFTYRKRGLQRKLSPRNAKGWLSLIAFAALVTTPGVGILPWMLERSEWLLVPYFTAVGLLTWAFMTWAIGKSERVGEP